MEFILHIGDSKCGSSAIQRALADSANVLADKRVLYVPIYPRRGHGAYISLLGAPTRGNTAEQKVLAERNICETREAIEAMEPDFVVLSSEAFFNFLPSDIVQLLKRIEPNSSGVHVVAFVRNSDEMYISSSVQRLRASSWFKHPKEFVHDVHRPIERWAQQPELRSVTVDNYRSRTDPGGGVVSDFGNILGMICGCGAVHLQESAKNDSLSVEQAQLMQCLRRRYYPGVDGKMAVGSNNVFTFFQKLNEGYGTVGSRPEPRGYVRDVVIENNSPTVQKLVKKFPWLRLAYGAASWRSRTLAAILPSSRIKDVIKVFDRAVYHKLGVLVPKTPVWPQVRSRRRVLRRLFKSDDGKYARRLWSRYIGKVDLRKDRDG